MYKHITWLSFWERSREGKLGVTVFFIFITLLAHVIREESSFGREAGRETWGERLFASCSITFLVWSGPFGSAQGRKCVMLSDNGRRKPRDRHIHLGATVKSSQLALPFTVRDVTVLKKYIITVTKISFFKKCISKL